MVFRQSSASTLYGNPTGGHYRAPGCRRQFAVGHVGVGTVCAHHDGMTSASRSPVRSSSVSAWPFLLVAVWGAWLVAVVVGGLFSVLPPVVVPLTIWTPVIGLAVATVRGSRVAQWARRLSVRGMVAFHIVRFGFGAWFLVLESRGELDPLFAQRAGYGDVVSGGLALLVVLGFRVMAPELRARVVRIWNVIALADILLVFFTAQYVLFFGSGIAAMQPLVTVPGSLVPTFVVPTILITHFWMLWRRGG